jgi:hypothetical protein
MKKTNRKIFLTNGGFSVVSHEDYEKISASKWRRETDGYVALSSSAKRGSASVFMHRQILDCHGPVDHADGDRTNNARENLRACTARQNSANRSRPKNNTSGFKGVTWHKQLNRWQVTVGRGKGQYVGVFRDRVEAALAYDNAAVARYGNFANLNFPNGVS